MDRFAHNESWEEQRKPYVDREVERLDNDLQSLRDDMSGLQRFKEQAKGGFFTLGTLVSGGLLVVILHWLGVHV